MPIRLPKSESTVRATGGRGALLPGGPGERCSGSFVPASTATRKGNTPGFRPLAGSFALTPGDILVVDPALDRVPETEGRGALFRVDPVTGAREILSDFGDGANPGFVPLDPAVEADGRVLVIASRRIERGIEPGIESGTLFRVDPASGAVPCSPTSGFV